MSDEIKLYETLGRIEASLENMQITVSKLDDRMDKVEKHVSLVRNFYWFFRVLAATVVAIVSLNWEKVAKLWHH